MLLSFNEFVQFDVSVCNSIINVNHTKISSRSFLFLNINCFLIIFNSNFIFSSISICFTQITVHLNWFSPFVFFLFLSVYFFNLLIYYIQRESPKRAASFGIFTLNIKCSLKCEKCIRKKSDIFFTRVLSAHNVVTFFISHVSRFR